MSGSVGRFTPDTIEYLMRTGYVVRHIDEAVGEEPRSLEQLNLDVIAEHDRSRRTEAKESAFGESGRRLTKKKRRW